MGDKWGVDGSQGGGGGGRGGGIVPGLTSGGMG